MGQNETTIINELIKKTDSVLIIFFVLVIISSVIVIFPIYRLMIKEKNKKNESENERLDKYIKRESQLLDIISKNSEIISQLKTLLEITSNNFNDTVNKLHDKISSIDDKIDNISGHNIIIDNKVDNITKLQAKMNKESIDIINITKQLEAFSLKKEK